MSKLKGFVDAHKVLLSAAATGAVAFVEAMGLAVPGFVNLLLAAVGLTVVHIHTK